MRPTHPFLSLLCIALFPFAPSSATAAKPQNDGTARSPHPDQTAGLNILFITVDDMSADSIGAFGCELPDTSPNVDQLAADGLRFEHMHVVVGNCKPSRNVMWSGRFPHNSGVEGFYNVPEPDYPHLVDLMKAGGYFTGIRGKVSHSTPYYPYAWDADLDTDADGNKHHMKDAKSYYLSTRDGIAAAKAAGKPFCLIINISDPHKPFYAEKGKPDPHIPSKVWTGDEVPVPRFLPDDPAVRTEVAEYYNSVRRADDCAGEILRALEESGQKDNTVIMFLSDHGMPLPFAKTQLYHHSTHTPFIVKYPGLTKPGAVDNQHVLSAVDLLPTLLDVAGIDHPEGFDGQSFFPALGGEALENRNFAYKEYNENSARTREPMRSVQGRRFGYTFNPWSNGERLMKTATQGTVTYKTMQELAKTDEYIAGRVRLIDHRVLEEFYDYENDPDGLNNLIDDPEYKEELDRHRQALENHMTQTNDFALEAFRVRDDQAALDEFMADQAAQTAARKGSSKKPKNAKLIKLQSPDSFTPGKPITVKIPHTIPADLGEQSIHVTLKAGNDAKRLERKVLPATGKGTLEVGFDLPAQVPDNTISFSAFIGKDFQESLQHHTSEPIPAK